MKKILLIIFANMLVFSTFSQEAFNSRLIVGDEGYLYFQLQQTAGSTNPDGTHLIGNITFEISWPNALTGVDVKLVCTTNDYEIEEEAGDKRVAAGIFYRKFANFSGSSFAPVEDWVNGPWYTIAKLKVTDSESGIGSFSIYNHNDNEFNFSYDTDGSNAVDPDENYTPSIETGEGTINGYFYPTVIYDHVWNGSGASGGTPSDWSHWANWDLTCGGFAGPPNSGSNVYIPGTVSTFPSINLGGSMACNNLRIATAAILTVPSVNGTLAISGDLKVYGTFYIKPNANATVIGITYLDAAECLIVEATTSGAGSFIDNGSIDYSELGTAKVQTFLSNSAGAGNFDIHLVGPTLNQENYSGAGTGAYLGEFILGGVDTYAYEWDETIPDNDDAWVNLSSLTEEIHSAKGIGLSTIDDSDHNLEMTGYLITGDVSSPSLTFSDNHWELISNPYPSSVDFDALQTLNGNVNNKFSLWNPVANSWVEYAGGAGVDRFIQVGQGFFVETNSTGTFDFTNSERAHSNNAFREIIPNLLTITAEGGVEGYEDIAIVRFTDEATSGYDINLEAEFWKSQNSDATSLRSVTDDNLQLAINALPTESLFGKDLLSVPLKFDCGYTTDYTLTFNDIESFEIGTEIYLEDTKTGEEWVYLNDNPVYTFTAAEYQSSDRFIIHFFGPTDIEELNAETINIYSSGQYAYVRNNTQENIKMIYVYNLASELVMSTKKYDNQKLHKFWVSDNVGYYIVKVVTDTNIYTEKVLIFK